MRRHRANQPATNHATTRCNLLRLLLRNTFSALHLQATTAMSASPARSTSVAAPASHAPRVRHRVHAPSCFLTALLLLEPVLPPAASSCPAAALQIVHACSAACLGAWPLWPQSPSAAAVTASPFVRRLPHVFACADRRSLLQAPSAAAATTWPPKKTSGAPPPSLRSFLFARWASAVF